MKPPTPQIDAIFAEAHAYLQWWIDSAWWHSPASFLAALVLLYALIGGLRASFFGKSPGAVERDVTEKINRLSAYR